MNGETPYYDNILLVVYHENCGSVNVALNVGFPEVLPNECPPPHRSINTSIVLPVVPDSSSSLFRSAFPLAGVSSKTMADNPMTSYADYSQSDAPCGQASATWPSDFAKRDLQTQPTKALGEATGNFVQE